MKAFRFFLAVALLALVVFVLFRLFTAEKRDPAQPAAVEPVAQVEALGSDLTGETFFAGQPRADGYPHPLTIIERDGFQVAYDEQRKNPAWVAYRLFDVPDSTSTAKRPSRFKRDKQTRSRVGHDDYTRSGYDRGHMAPNHGIALRYGKNGQRDTFMMSNIVPQQPALNQGPWRILEARISGYAEKLEEVFVITGPLYDETPKLLPVGVEVPDAFFKVVVDIEGATPRVLAFILPQGTPRKAKPAKFLVSVDQIEAQAGFDLFHELQDPLEERWEAVAAPGMW